MGGDNIVIEPLDAYNYGTWSVRMKALLVTKGLWRILEASRPQDPEASRTYDESSEKALALLTLNVTNPFLNLLEECNSAKEAWDKLKNTYNSQLNARRLQLRKDLTHLKKLPEESLTQYFSTARKLWSDLQASGLSVTETEVVFSALAGLPDDYNTAVTVITSTTTGDLHLDTVLAQLLQVEAQVRAQNIEKDQEVLLARGGARNRAAGRVSNNRAPTRTFHNPPYNSTRTDDKRKKGLCWYCSKPGHHADECRKKKADEQRRAFTATTDECESQAASSVVLSAAHHTEHSTMTWTMDSGAQRHITANPALLRDLRPLAEPVTVVFGNKTTGTAYAQGTAIFNAKTSGATRQVMLKDVLLVPECTMGNLLSVKQATKEGAVVIFDSPDKCRILKGGTPVIEAKSPGNGLYYIEATPVLSATSATGAVKIVESAQLWHRRFGHLGYDNLAKLVKQDMVKGINVPAKSFESASHQLCDECVKAKHPRLPFPLSEASKTSRPLELVHMDLCGPISPASQGGARYIATFLDDHTGLSAVKPLTNKHQVPDTVREVLNYLENQCGAKVKCVRTDRGSEYCNTALSTYFKSKGIRHETTAPYSPQQNGAAERLNRTLFERIRAMLDEAGLPKTLWAEAAVTANYIRNRSPTNSRAKTPWELFYNKPPDVSHMRTFGCTAYARIPDEYRKKLDSRSAKGIFLGYEPASKAYRILLDTGKMVISRDVIFDESTSTLEWNTEPEEPSATPTPSVPPPEEPPRVEPPVQSTENIPPRYVATEPREHPEEANRFPKRSREAPSEWWKVKRQAVTYALTANTDPVTLEDALSRPDADMWRQAMDEELTSLHENKTWTLTTLPPGCTAIPVKWVYKVKRDANGNIERYKARLVAKGYMQREGIDYTEVFAPTSNHTTASIRQFLYLLVSSGSRRF